MPVDREVIELYMKILNIKDVEQANAAIERLQKKSGQPITVEGLAKISADTKRLTAFVQESRREFQGMLMDIAKVDAGIRRTLSAADRSRLAKTNPINEPLGLTGGTTLVYPDSRMQAYQRGGHVRLLGAHLGAPQIIDTKRAELEMKARPTGFVGSMARQLGLKAVEIERNTATIIAGANRNAQRQLDLVQKYGRHVVAEGKAPLSQLMLRSFNIQGVNPRMIPYIFSQLGTSAIGLTPKALATGTAYASPLSSIAPIEGGVGQYLSFGEPTQHTVHQQTTQALLAMQRRGYTDVLRRRPPLHPLHLALPANEQLAAAFSVGGTGLWSLTPRGQDAYRYMRFEDYPGYMLQDTARGQAMMSAAMPKMSHREFDIGWAPHKPERPSNDIFFKYADELHQFTPSLHDVAMKIADSRSGIFSNKILQSAGPYAQAYVSSRNMDTRIEDLTRSQREKIGRSLSDSSNIDRIRKLNALGHPTYTFASENALASQMIMEANPLFAGKYDVSKEEGTRARFGDAYDFFTGPYARKALGSQANAAYMTGQVGQTIAGGADVLAPNQIIRLGEVLADFSKVLSPSGKWDPIVNALGGPQQLGAIVLTVQQAIDTFTSRFGEYDRLIALQDDLSRQLSPEWKREMGFEISRRRATIGQSPEEKQLVNQDFLEDIMKRRSAEEGLFTFSKKKKGEVIVGREKDEFTIKPAPEEVDNSVVIPGQTPLSPKQYWVPPWMRRGVSRQELLGEDITGYPSFEEEQLAIRKTIYGRERKKRLLGGLEVGQGELEAAQIAGMLPEAGYAPSISAEELDEDYEETEEDVRRREANYNLGTVAPVLERNPSTPPSRKMGRLEQFLDLSKKMASSKTLKTALPFAAGLGISALMAHFAGPSGALAGMGMLPFMMGSIKSGDPYKDFLMSEYQGKYGPPPAEGTPEEAEYYNRAKKEFATFMGKGGEAQPENMATPGQGPFSALPSGGAKTTGGNPPEKPPGRFEKAALQGLYKLKDPDRVKLSGFLSFGINKKDEEEHQKAMAEAIKALEEIPGVQVKPAVGGRHLLSSGYQPYNRIGFKTSAAPGTDAEDVASRLGKVLDAFPRSIDKQLLISGQTVKQMNKAADAQLRFITGSETGNINSTKITGVLQGETDQILEMEKALRDMNGVMTTSVENFTDMSGGVASDQQSILRFNGTIRETGDAVEENMKSTIENKGAMSGQVSMIGKYSSSLDMLSERWQKFVGYGKDLKGLSRGMLQLQMGFLGVYFSMMSVVGMLQQGIGAITNPLKDLNGMIESFALSNAFAGEGALTGNKILEDYGLTLEDIFKGWQKMSWLGSTLNMELGAFGAKIFGDPETWKKIEDAMMSLHQFLVDPETIRKVKRLLDGVADLMPSILRSMDGLLSILEKMLAVAEALDKIKLPGTEGLFGRGKPKLDEKGEPTGEYEAPTALQAVGTVGISSGVLLGAASMIALLPNLINLGYKSVLWAGGKLGLGGAGIGMAPGSAGAAAAAAGPEAAATTGAAEGAAVAGGGSVLAGAATTVGWMAAFVALEETGRKMYNTNVENTAKVRADLKELEGSDNEQVALMAKITGSMVDIKSTVLNAFAPGGLGQGGSLTENAFTKMNALTGGNTLWDYLFPKTEKGEAAKPTQIQQDIAVNTSVTNIIYGDYLQSTNDKVADRTNQTMKDIFVSGSVT